jgi:hypothetical protein
MGVVDCGQKAMTQREIEARPIQAPSAVRIANDLCEIRKRKSKGKVYSISSQLVWNRFSAEDAAIFISATLNFDAVRRNVGPIVLFGLRPERSAEVTGLIAGRNGQLRGVLHTLLSSSR